MDGRVWMVSGAIPGDRVEARAVRVRDRFVEAVAVRVVHPSPLARPAPCPIQRVCGGCPLMRVAEAEQREAKRRFVLDALERIGRLGGLTVAEVVAAPPFVAYRNKIELSFGTSRPRTLGYHRADDPAEIVDVRACAIADSRLQPLLEVSRAFFLEGPGASEPALEKQGDPVRLVIRASVTTGDRLIALRGPAGSFASAEAFAGAAREADPGLVGVVRLVGGGGRRGGTSVVTIAGRDWIEEEIYGIRYEVPAGTFLQVHPKAMEAIGELVLPRARGARRVLELYGGIGPLALALAQNGTSVIVVDADAGAVACGAEAVRRHRIETARFARADVLDFLDREGKAAAPDLVIADPPRTGLGRGVAERLAALGAERIAMISCDPATLARDLAALVARGYAAESVTPIDLFPQTAHVETVTWLTRARG